MALLRSGKQIMGLMSRSQQQLGFGRYLTTSSSKTTHHYHHRFLCANYNTNVNTDNTTTNNESESLPKPSKGGFFSKLLFWKASPPPVPPNPNHVQVKIRTIFELVKKVKSCPKEEEKVLVDEIIRLYHDMIFKWNEVRIVLALHQFSRIDLSNRTRPELVSVYNFNHLLEYIPIDIMPSIRDTTADVLVAKYGYLLDRGIKVILEPTRMRVIADVGDIAWYHLKAFIAGDLVVVTGTHIRDHPPFRFKPVPQRMVKIPRFPYLQEEIKAFTPANNQGQLNIVFDRVDESKVDDDIPKIYRPKIYSYDLE